MNIEGTYTLQAAEGEVWDYLMDPEVLRATIPGLERIEPVAPSDTHAYDVTIAINYAPVMESFQGRIIFSDQHYPYHYHLSIERDDSKGTFNSSGNVSLRARGNTTIIAYKGTLTFNKPHPQLSPSILKGAIKLFIQQYFLALAERIQNERQIQSMANGTADQDGIIKPIKESGDELTIEIHQERTGLLATSPTIYSRIVSLLRLGAGDPERALQWEQRLRRASVISSLLFLVWVGTRLPRRR